MYDLETASKQTNHLAFKLQSNNPVFRAVRPKTNTLKGGHRTLQIHITEYGHDGAVVRGEAPVGEG
jgi:hypothetical protein